MFRTGKALAAAVLASALGLGACSADSTAQDPLIVMATATPHSEILEWIDEQNDDIDLDVRVLTELQQGNMAVADGSADVNFFNHAPYRTDWENQTGKKLTELAQVHIEPMAMYSEKFNTLDELPDNARISIPTSPSNIGRALVLLQAHGVIKLDQPVDPGTVSRLNLTNIAENPKNIELVSVEDMAVIQTINDPKVDAVITSAAYAMDANYDPVDDSVIVESPENNPYVNTLDGREDSMQDPRVQRLVEEITSKETADWITNTYGNAVVPLHA